MIDIYTEKKNTKDWIIKNDLFFNLTQETQYFTVIHKQITPTTTIANTPVLKNKCAIIVTTNNIPINFPENM